MPTRQSHIEAIATIIVNFTSPAARSALDCAKDNGCTIIQQIQLYTSKNIVISVVSGLK